MECEPLISSKIPPFTLPAYHNGEFIEFTTRNRKAEWLLLFFYPADFTIICPQEIVALNKRYEDFQSLGCQVVGISTDSVYVHKEWSKSLGDIKFPLLSDRNGAVSKIFRVYDNKTGTAHRGVFILDPQDILVYQLVHHDKLIRNIDELLNVIVQLKTAKINVEHSINPEKKLSLD